MKKEKKEQMNDLYDTYDPEDDELEYEPVDLFEDLKGMDSKADQEEEDEGEDPFDPEDFEEEEDEEDSEESENGAQHYRRVSPAIWVILIMLNLLALLILIVVNLFTVQKVVVENNKLYEDKVIEQAVLNDDGSWNTIYMVMKYRFVEPESFPFIETMEVSMADPHTLRIHVYEKGLLGYLKDSDLKANVYFDTGGIVAEISERIIEDVPEIHGMEYEGEVKLYEPLPVGNATLRSLLNLTQTLKRNNMIPDSVSFADSSGPVLTYGDIYIVMGNSDFLTQKVERAAAIYEKLEGKRGTLHLENWSEETTGIIFNTDEAAGVILPPVSGEGDGESDPDQPTGEGNEGGEDGSEGGSEGGNVPSESGGQQLLQPQIGVTTQDY